MAKLGASAAAGVKMITDPLGAIPTEDRAAVRRALTDVAGKAAIGPLIPIAGGASGAAIFKVEIGERAHLLRVEGPDNPRLRRNPHRYACMRLAAEAGFAPAVRHIDEAAGVSVMDFVEQRPLGLFPGGPLGLARALGALLREVQAMPTFPRLVYYPDLLTRLLEDLRDAAGFEASLFDRHVERLTAIRAELDWDDTPAVASHNDPNRGNVLFDGARLWLIDWESAYRNDPLVDVAIVLDNLAPSEDAEDVLLQAWLGDTPGAALHARLRQVRSLTRLYYACFLLNAGGPEVQGGRHSDASAPSAPEFDLAVRQGRLVRGAPQTARALGRLFLSGFPDGRHMPGLEAALGTVLD